MENRYDKKLRQNNQQIITLSPANQTLRLITAKELDRVYHSKDMVLEIGCGEGDSARYVLENSKASLDLLDISKEMIGLSKKNLKKFSRRIKYVHEDALTYLKRAQPYNIIFSEWTIHNFKWKEKLSLLEAIYANLAQGGTFILMDKVYPNNGGLALLAKQLKRYSYLKMEVAQQIISHEKQDYSKNYRMDEKLLLSLFKKIGFKNIRIADRVERDIVLIAKKS